MKPEIIADSLVKRFNDLLVLNHISFNVYPGEFLCIVGPSGCGKSTLIRILLGLEKPDEGRVEIHGHSPNPRMCKCIGYVPQDDALFPWRTVLKNVLFGLELKNENGEKALEKAHQTIKMVGLSGFENYYPHQLSGGMRKRVALARAVAVDPQILLMDEPFANIDAQTRALLQVELMNIWSKLRKTVVFVTHNVEEAVFLADRVLVLTKRPAKVKAEIPIELPRPRKRLSPQFISVRERIIRMLKEEVSI
ncbi:MAG TPA: ABC transporter ATP-binding protein [Candidatus Methanomethylia archaeon]|nr:ABC transporter ATP-binding protein [Candidatus Methanomethylicia archaeon]